MLKYYKNVYSRAKSAGWWLVYYGYQCNFFYALQVGEMTGIMEYNKLVGIDYDNYFRLHEKNSFVVFTFLLVKVKKWIILYLFVFFSSKNNIF